MADTTPPPPAIKGCSSPDIIEGAISSTPLISGHYLNSIGRIDVAHHQTGGHAQEDDPVSDNGHTDVAQH
jgi:hypothetical protein